MIVFAFVLAIQDTTGLTLVRAVERALGQYPTVAAARALHERAGAEASEQRAALLPRLSLDATAMRWELPAVAFPIHGIPTAPGQTPPGGPLVFDETTYQGSVFLNWTFFDFGARRGRARAARSAERASLAALSSAEQQLAARTASAYLQVLTARQVLAAQDQRLTALAAEAERARRLFTEGRGARLALLRAAAELARARAERAGAAGRLDVAEHELVQLVDAPVAALAGVALRDSLPPPGRAWLLARARETSPELAEAASRAEAARTAAGAARATRLPELRLSAGIVPRGSSSEVRTEWQAGLGVSWPLYTGGQRSAQIARADADARVASEQHRLAALNATQAVDRAIASAVEARARVVALEAAVAASEAVAETERTALEVGAGTQTDYLDALTSLVRERAGLIDARHTEIAARVELLRVTGALSPESLSRLLEDR